MIDIGVLKKRYITEFGEEPCKPKVLLEIESVLNVKLPNDFKEIASFYSGGFLGGISHHSLAIKGEATSIVQETLRIREAISLDNDYLVLAEPPESIIVMKCTGSPAILWCDAVEVRNINSQKFENTPDTWDSYSAFFKHLLDEEDEL